MCLGRRDLAEMCLGRLPTTSMHLSDIILAYLLAKTRERGALGHRGTSVRRIIILSLKGNIQIEGLFSP